MSASPMARDLRTLVREQLRDDVEGKSPLPMETEGQKPPEGGLILVVVCCGCVICCWWKQQNHEMSVERMWV